MSESLLGRWGRRALTFSLVTLAWVVIVPGLCFLPVLLLCDLILGKAWTRAYLAAFTLLSCEVIGLLLALAMTPAFLIAPKHLWLHWNQRLQQNWIVTILALFQFIYRFEVVIEGDKVSVGEGPFIVLVRHVSLIDALVPSLVLGRWNLRYILKAELLWDPCLDLVGQRLPNVFTRRGSKDPAKEITRIGQLAEDLNQEGAILIYPEGTRFSQRKREKRIASLQEAGKTELCEKARQLKNVLAPKTGGAYALVSGNPQAGLLSLSHTGLEGTMKLSNLLAGTLIRRQIKIRIDRFPASEVPREKPEFEGWLWQRWADMDAWVGDQLGERKKED